MSAVTPRRIATVAATASTCIAWTPCGTWTHVQHVAGEENPSLFTLRPESRVLCSVHGGLTYVSAFDIDRASGDLRLLNRQACSGSNPVDAALSADQPLPCRGEPRNGNIASLPLEDDGSLRGDAGVPYARDAGTRSGSAECDPSACGDFRSDRSVRGRPRQGLRLYVHLQLRRRRHDAAASPRRSAS